MGWKNIVNSVLPGSGYVFDKVGGGLKSAWDDFTGKTAIDKQNEYNMQMWQMQNEYNTPANQVKRYLEAGLNPNLIYGNGSSSAGNASHAPEMTAHQGNAAKLLGLVQQVASLRGELMGQELQKTKTLADIAHSADVLEFEKKRFLIDYLFRDMEFANKDRDYNLAREKWEYEKNHLDLYGTKPGTTIDFVNRLMSNTFGKSTTDVATDTSNILNNLFGFLGNGIVGFTRDPLGLKEAYRRAMGLDFGSYRSR